MFCNGKQYMHFRKFLCGIFESFDYFCTTYTRTKTVNNSNSRNLGTDKLWTIYIYNVLLNEKEKNVIQDIMFRIIPFL